MGRFFLGFALTRATRRLLESKGDVVRHPDSSESDSCGPGLSQFAKGVKRETPKKSNNACSAISEFGASPVSVLRSFVVDLRLS